MMSLFASLTGPCMFPGEESQPVFAADACGAWVAVEGYYYYVFDIHLAVCVLL